VCHPWGRRLRAFAQGVSLSAFVLKRSPQFSLCRRGEPAEALVETYTLADYSWCEGSGVAHAARWPRRMFRPGDGRARTADPLLAKQVLSQLSYIPVLAGRVTA
jgi:hypothetical protein